MSIKTKRIQRLGNSAAIIIDSIWLKEKGLQIGDFILIKMNDKIIIDPEVPSEKDIHKEILEFEKQLEAKTQVGD